MDDVKYEGEEFSHLLNNVITENKDKTIKVLVAKNLKILSKIDKELPNYLILYCLEILEISLHYDNQNISQNDILFSNKIPCEERVDIAFLVLNILNEYILNSEFLI